MKSASRATRDNSFDVKKLARRANKMSKKYGGCVLKLELIPHERKKRDDFGDFAEDLAFAVANQGCNM